MTETRTETDSMGAIEVPAERLWGAQTQRSLQNFAIGEEKMPAEIVHALGIVKQAVEHERQRGDRECRQRGAGRHTR